MATKKTTVKETVKRPTANKPQVVSASRITAAKTEAPKVARPAAQPNHDEIAQLAYGYFVERGYAHGYHVEDWQRAEKNLRSAR